MFPFPNCCTAMAITLIIKISWNKYFQTWHLIAMQHSCQPIRSHVRKSLLTSMDFHPNFPSNPIPWCDVSPVVAGRWLKSSVVGASAMRSTECHYMPGGTRRWDTNQLPNNEGPLSIYRVTIGYGDVFCIAGSLWGEADPLQTDKYLSQRANNAEL